MFVLPPLCRLLLFFLWHLENKQTKTKKKTIMKRSLTLVFFSNTPTVSIRIDKLGNNTWVPDPNPNPHPDPTSSLGSSSSSSLSSDAVEADNSTSQSASPSKQKEDDNETGTISRGDPEPDDDISGVVDEPYSVYEVE